MPTYTEKDYKRYWKGTVSGSTTKTATEAFTIPRYGTLLKVQVGKSPANSMSITDSMASVGWSKWTTKTSLLNWSNGGKPKLGVSANNLSFTITWHFYVKITNWEKVVGGNKIMANDRGKSGTTTNVGSIISDSNFTPGTKITASDFHSKYGYTI